MNNQMLAKILDRKERFEELNTFVRSRSGWLISVPGDVEVMLETLVDSSLPDELRKRGHKLEVEPDGQRILPCGIVEKFERGIIGELVPAPIGSTRPVVEVRHHAGIVRTRRYSFAL